MAESQNSSPQIEPALAVLLRALRGQIRRYVTIEGAAWAIAWLGMAFWFSLLIDWWLEPDVQVRMLVIAGAVAGLIYVVGQYLIGRLLVRMSDASMALLLERRFPKFQNSLVTAVELAKRKASNDGFNPELLAETGQMALRQTAGVNVAEVLNPRPLRAALIVSAMLAVSILLFGVLAPSAFGIWSRRTFAFSNELWPRQVELLVDGFKSGRIKVARGDDVKLVVKARNNKEIPRYVQIYYRDDEGDRGQPRMIRDGIAAASDQYQDYSYSFASVRSSINFDVYGGDATVKGLRIEVVDSPTIRRLAVHCDFPAYTRRAAVDLPVTSSIELPQGTRITVRAETNKDLTSAVVEYPVEGGSPASTTIALNGKNKRQFDYLVEQLAADRTLTFHLTDADGITNREPIRLTLLAVPDQKPALAVGLQGIGTAITPQARIPVAGKITDDYGLQAGWFEYTIDDGQLATRDFTNAPADRLELEVDVALEVGGLELRPGQKLLMGISVRDNRGLAEGPQTADGERYLLDVVSGEDLLMMLVARELSLRQRFEAIKEELETTRDGVATVRWPSAAQKFTTTSFVAQAAPVEPEGDAAEPVTDQQRLLASHALQVERAVQNSRKESQETLGVAAAFDQIRAELINNRVDNEELRSRLKEGIADPVRRIGDAMYPELEQRLEALKSSLENPTSAQAAQGSSIAQMNAIVAEMDVILDRMQKLENFNELVARLRKIVDMQQEMVEITKRRRTEKLRSLEE